MKKRIILIVAVLLVIIIAAMNFVPNYFVNMISDYDKVSFDVVLQSDNQKNEVFHIGENTSPKDYGFDYEDIIFHTYDSSLMLSAWYMEQLYDSIRSDQAIILLHGRTSNRLKPMKFLQLFKENGYDSSFHYFLPDMRRSGLSPDAKTGMGYYFAEDLAGGLRWLADAKGIKSVIIYAFSMGAQATNVLLLRDDLQNIFTDYDLQIDALIFDSPLANVEETLLKSSQEMGIPGFAFNMILNQFDRQHINNHLAKQKMHLCINAFEGPTLLLQSKKDETTHYDIFEKEVALMIKRPNLQIKVFENGEHVKMYVTESERIAYIEEVLGFMGNYLK